MNVVKWKRFIYKGLPQSCRGDKTTSEHRNPTSSATQICQLELMSVPNRTAGQKERATR